MSNHTTTTIQPFKHPTIQPHNHSNIQPFKHPTTQGKPSTSLYFLMEGKVEILKEIDIIFTQRWPKSPTTWELSEYKQSETFSIKTVTRNSVPFFGEEGFLGLANNEHTVRCVTRVKTLVLPQSFFLLMYQIKTISFFRLRYEARKKFTLMKIKDELTKRYSTSSAAAVVSNSRLEESSLMSTSALLMNVTNTGANTSKLTPAAAEASALAAEAFRDNVKLMPRKLLS